MPKLKRKFTILFFIIVLITIVATLIFSNLVNDVSGIFNSLSENKIRFEAGPSYTPGEGYVSKMPDNVELTAHFWEIDPNSFEKGEHVGLACIAKGKIYINVQHSNLKAILENPYTPIEITNKSLPTPYKPGTHIHLQSIARESWRWKYTAEVRRK
ncbi:MAG: hypothetical protein P9M06_06595 [Candidatus Saelkia tenebricola]|nr:hypothetical protein [Candidatus Saelkia tenebricola]